MSLYGSRRTLSADAWVVKPRAWQAQPLQSDSDLAAVVSTYAQDVAGDKCNAVGVSMTRY
jgi:hypothetical protein